LKFSNYHEFDGIKEDLGLLRKGYGDMGIENWV
jgi:hypothetical protein